MQVGQAMVPTLPHPGVEHTAVGSWLASREAITYQNTEETSTRETGSRAARTADTVAPSSRMPFSPAAAATGIPIGTSFGILETLFKYSPPFLGITDTLLYVRSPSKYIRFVAS